MIKKNPGIGYALMMSGALIYLGVFIIINAYTPEFSDLNEYINYSKLMTALGFFGVIIFMLGAILEIKALWFSIAKMVYNNQATSINDDNNKNNTELEYTTDDSALNILIIIVFVSIIIIVAFLLMTSGALG